VTVSDSRWAAGTNSYQKTVENRLRRVAERQGLILRKNRRRDRRATDYGVWFLERVTPEGTECLVETRDLQEIAARLDEDI
jgi:hypothetical protein